MSILIQNGTLLLPEGPVKADLRVEGERIAQIGPGLPAEGSQLIDAAGKLVFPGFIDTHTHFEMNQGTQRETADNWTTGTRAALAGGTTCVLDFAEPQRGHSLASALEVWQERAEGRASCHYGFHMTIKDWDPRIRDELRAMTAAGITSYKVYMAYAPMRISDRTALEVVRAVGEAGGIVGCHCENGDLVDAGIAAMHAEGRFGPDAHPSSRPPAVEAEAVGRWLAIGELAGYPVNIVHLSTRRGLEQVLSARQRGQALYAESCPQYLTLTEDKYRLPGFEGAKFVCAPPLRTPEDAHALWIALAAGELDTIGTDHCSFRFAPTKQLGEADFAAIPGGIPGVEHRVELMYTYGVSTGRITAHQMMKALSERPAKLFGMYPRKGALAVGSDADITILDPNASRVITAAGQVQNVDYTPYEGMESRCGIDTVLLSGAVAAQRGRVLLENRGRYVRRGSAQFWR